MARSPKSKYKNIIYKLLLTMKKHLLFVYWYILASPFAVFSQTSVHVADMSFKMSSNSTEEFYYSFAEGDVLVVDFELKKGKGVDFEIVELPSQTKTKQFTARITNYRINVTSTKVYLFRVTNGLGNKLCSLSIKRIPRSQETVNFNTAWQWKTLYDTTYITYKEDSLVGHDTVHFTESMKEVASKEMSEVVLANNNELVHSIGYIDHDNPRKFIKIQLPENQKFGNTEQRIYGWTYWIGVTSKKSHILSNLIKGGTTVIPGIPKLVKYLLGTAVDITIPKESETDIIYWYLVNNGNDANNFINGQYFSCVTQGYGTGAYSKFVNNNTQGTYYICLYNKEYVHWSVNVYVQVVALVETITYKDVEYHRTKIVPKYVKLTKTRRNISSRQVRIPVEESKK